jgi:hypothetical protein
MSEVYIKEDAGLSLDRANKLLAGIGNSSGVFKAVHAALRRAAQSAKAKAGTFASSRYYISAGGFKGHVVDKIAMEGGAHAGGVTGVKLTFAGSVIRLIEFNTRFSRDGGVAVSVKRGSGGVIANGFIANTGRFGVYERVGPSRLPIEQKFGPSAAHMMMDEQVTSKMEQQIVETFNERIDHEIDRILNGW